MVAEEQVEKLSKELEKAKNDNEKNELKITFLEQMLKEKTDEVKENRDVFRWLNNLRICLSGISGSSS